MEVIDPKDEQGDIEQEDNEVKAERLNDGGRQENSLRTVRSISQVLYTNTGWSVHTCLGQAYCRDLLLFMGSRQRRRSICGGGN